MNDRASIGPVRIDGRAPAAGDRTDRSAIVHLPFAADRGANAAHLVAQPLVHLGDAVEDIGDLCEQRLLGDRETDLEITVAEIPHCAQQPTQIDVSDLSVRSEQIHFALRTFAPGGGSISVTISVSFSVASLAAVPPISVLAAAGLRTGRSG